MAEAPPVKPKKKKRAPSPVPTAFLSESGSGSESETESETESNSETEESSDGETNASPARRPPPVPKKKKSSGSLDFSAHGPAPPVPKKKPPKKPPKKPRSSPQQRRTELLTGQLLLLLKTFPEVPWDHEVAVNHLAQNAEDVMKNFCITKNAMRMATRGFLEPMREYAYDADKRQVLTLLEMTLSSLHKANKDINYPKLKVSKCVLDFGFKPSEDENAPTGLPKNVCHKDTLVVRNSSPHQAQVTIQHFRSKANSKTYSMKIEPTSFTLRGNGRQTVAVTINIHSGSVKLKEILSIELKGTGSCAEAMQQRPTIPIRLLALVKANSEFAVFGVPLDQAIYVDCDGIQVPGVLVELHKLLKQADAWNIVGIFRKAASEGKLQTAKLRLNRGDDVAEFDHNVHATLIKVYFRDMPERLFSSIPLSQLEQAARSRAKAVQLVSELPQHKKQVLEWLTRMMTEVALKADVNLMEPKNCGIVMGPNLAPVLSDPMKSVTVMQSVNLIFQHIINARLTELTKPSE